MKKIKFYVISALLILFVGLLVYGVKNTNTKSSGRIQIVAAENFWGSLASQIGGNKVNVFSVINDPNIDPHEYEASSLDAKKIAQSNLVILNGAGYDAWASQMLASTNNSKIKEINVAKLVNAKKGANPHFWYNPDYVNLVNSNIARVLENIDPKDKSYFARNLKTLDQKMSVYQNKVKYIANHFKNIKVAATEDIFQYLASSAKLNLISPLPFIQAVAEGSDPPTQSVVQFENQILTHQAKILVYNVQTITPLTSEIKALASKNNIPIVGVSETIQPTNLNFEDWMNIELTNIIKALRE